jgi:hypothetical protein
MENVLIGRIEPYFRHLNPDHDVLKVGDRSVACRNVRQVLTWLGLSPGSASQHRYRVRLRRQAQDDPGPECKVFGSFHCSLP